MIVDFFNSREPQLFRSFQNKQIQNEKIRNVELVLLILKDKLKELHWSANEVFTSKFTYQ